MVDLIALDLPVILSVRLDHLDHLYQVSSVPFFAFILFLARLVMRRATADLDEQSLSTYF